MKKNDQRIAIVNNSLVAFLTSSLKKYVFYN